MVKIIGYGNPFRKDDAIGLWIVARLRYLCRPPKDRVSFWLGHQLLPELALWISDADIAIFIDSSLKVEDRKGWTFMEISPKDTLAHNMFHSIDVGGILSLCKSEYDRYPKSFLLAVMGYDFSYGAGLTERAKKASYEAIEFLKEFLFHK